MSIYVTIVDQKRTENLMFRCLSCNAPLGDFHSETAIVCARCSANYPVKEGIPVLVRDRKKLEQTLAEVKATSRQDWYEAPQSSQLEGPYRHHLLKRRQYIESVLDAYRERLGRAPIGIDMGCGDGNNVPWLLPHFAELHGSDYNFLRLRRATRLTGMKSLFLADITDYPVGDAACDVIFLNHVLEHIPQDEKALSELRRVLQPGGLAIIGVPNEGAAFWQLAYRLEPASRRNSDHVQFYTGPALAEKCASAGFIVQEVKPIGWGVPHWTLDYIVRRFKWIDDTFEFFGSRFLKSQATSLYVVLQKPTA